MLKVNCMICGKELTKFGAILRSPPDKQNKVNKFHICRKCFSKIIVGINGTLLS